MSSRQGGELLHGKAGDISEDTNVKVSEYGGSGGAKDVTGDGCGGCGELECLERGERPCSKLSYSHWIGDINFEGTERRNLGKRDQS